MNEITLIRGDTKILNVTFADSTGTAVNLTNMTVFFTVKNDSDLNNTTDDCAVLQKTVTSHSDPTHGITEITISSDDSNIPEGEYVWDMQLKTQAGNIMSTDKGTFIVSNDVTKRII